MESLYDLFKDAPSLGSLIDPGHVIGGNLIKASFDELTPFLEKVMSLEKDNYELNELKVAACGIADAVQILNGRYHLIITNVPYLARGKQSSFLKEYCTEHYKEAKNDLATVFLDRLLHFNLPSGTTALVLPQNWLFLTTYKKLRTRMLKTRRWDIVAQLGEGGFENSQAAGAFTALLIISAFAMPEKHIFTGLDATTCRTVQEKTCLLRDAKLNTILQGEQLRNPDARVVIAQIGHGDLLEQFAYCYKGITTGDDPHFRRVFWEFGQPNKGWRFLQSTVNKCTYYGGCEGIIWLDAMLNPLQAGVYVRARQTWGERGIAVAQMRRLPVAFSLGEPFDTNTAIILPYNSAHLPAIWCFCSSSLYVEAVRKIDQKLNVTNATLSFR
ncbi:MAG: Putative s-adenosyl-L-methionine-dependent methyltransferase [Desulfotomaculum sp. 46_296]|nr:MAG: Putative s-adenosyl-L-methionine-dependent methyltransferase [Desulfotomaculum sp. 46_296]